MKSVERAFQIYLELLRRDAAIDAALKLGSVQMLKIQGEDLAANALELERAFIKRVTEESR